MTEPLPAWEALTGRTIHPWESDTLESALPLLREDLTLLRTPPLHGLIPGDPAPHFGYRPELPLHPQPAPPAPNHPGWVPGGARKNNGSGIIAGLARDLRRGKTTSVELTKECLARLRAANPKLFCVISYCEERALAEAEQADKELAQGIDRGPLHGIPYGLKDLFAAQGAPTTFGATPYKDQILDFDSAVAERLKQAGAVLVAKLSLGELAYGDDWFGGKTRTPWNLALGSSGSSAGSASAVAAQCVPFAIGTETWGSIVSPSTRCGTVGLRPTFGRISRYGGMALCFSMDKVGPLCRTVADAAIVFAALQGADPRDPYTHSAPFRFRPHRSLSGVRLGIDSASEPASDIRETLEALGATLVPLTLPADEAIGMVASRTIQVETAANFAELMEDSARFQQLETTDYRDWKTLMRLGTLTPATEYLQAQRLRRRFYEQLEVLLNAEALAGYVTVPGSMTSTSLALTNLTGHPELVLQLGVTPEGMPQMLSFVGRLDQDDALLGIGYAFEKQRPPRWPEF